MKSSAKTCPNYGACKSVIEKIYQTEISCRYLHQTDFASRIPGSHKNTQFGGVLRGQFASANVRAEQPGRGTTNLAYNSGICPSRIRQTIPTCLPKSTVVAAPTHAPADTKPCLQIQQKEDAPNKGCILLTTIWICTCPSPAGS